MMQDDITDAYVEKRRREALAAQFVREIQTPSENPHRDHIEGEDVEALAMAIERCTADQVALWIKTLLDWAGDENFLDEVDWNSE
ncbi:MAG TPA: hypothetical protein VHD90_00875 [Phototrophicaceae bacterium]|nr:hypothetical protein [Phototrophicaceae bacterium]